jgi:hypothetical protein
MQITPILAEVGDKERTILAIWSISALFCIIGFTLAGWRPVIALLPVTLAALWACAIFSELRDPYVGPAILEELGRGYVFQAYTAALFPFLFIAVSFYRRRSNHRGAGGGGIASAFHLSGPSPAAPDRDRYARVTC